MADGTHYRARNGTVEIDNPAHARAYLRNEASDHTHLAGTFLSDAEIPIHRECEHGCRYTPWPWITTCPKCGGSIITKEPVE